MVSSLLILSAMALAAEPPPPTLRAIKEAENLSLLKDRLPACNVLIRALKKADKESAPVLREKLDQLSKYFYSDKGFQAYLAGKEFFEKQKFVDASEKLLESEELEKGNVDVLHYLSLVQLWQSNPTAADASNKRAQQINPYDSELIKDHLAILVAQENWAEVIKLGQGLVETDAQSLTLHFLALAKLKSGDLEEGKRLEAQALQKDSNLVEVYYWLGDQSQGDERSKNMEKYVESCKVKLPRFIERDPSVCTHQALAQQWIVAKSPETPKGLKKDKK